MTGATVYTDAHFGTGSGVIYLDDVTCTGLEMSLLSCTSSPFGIHNCQHSEDAGVGCAGNTSLTSV